MWVEGRDVDTYEKRLLDALPGLLENLEIFEILDGNETTVDALWICYINADTDA